MSTTTLEERVAALEVEVAQLRSNSATAPEKPQPPWWEKIFGAFANDPVYDEAMRLGRAYRESLRPRQARPKKN